MTKPPCPLFVSTVTPLVDSESATARSGLPSPLKSAATTKLDAPLTLTVAALANRPFPASPLMSAATKQDGVPETEESALEAKPPVPLLLQTVRLLLVAPALISATLPLP